MVHFGFSGVFDFYAIFIGRKWPVLIRPKRIMLVDNPLDKVHYFSGRGRIRFARSPPSRVRRKLEI